MESSLVGVVVGAHMVAAGDLRKLFLGQLSELFVQGFNFLFEGVEFFCCFQSYSSFAMFIYLLRG